jgi:hypothetical protein
VVYGYDVETKAHSSQQVSKTSPRPKKSAPSSIERQGHVDCFFSIMRELSIINLYLADRHEYGILFGSTKKFTRGSQVQKA